MTGIAGDLRSDQSVKKQVPGDVLMTGKMIGQKSGIPLVAFPLQLFQETESESETEKEKARKRRPRGELRKTGSPFVVLRMRLMKMDGLRYDVKSQNDRLKLLSYIGLITSEDYYTCASANLNWIR